MGQTLERIVVPALALLASAFAFGLLLVVYAGVDPLEAFALMYQGAFGSWFSWQNTLTRAAPLILTALCTALPARLGLVVIGNEGALVVGGVAAAAAGIAAAGAPPLVVQLAMAVAAMAAGGLWIALAGALRQWRGVNETISSLLLTYIAIALMNHFVEGPLRDPSSLNKPSTWPIGDANMIGTVPGTDVHWGLVYGVVACLLAWIFQRFTTWGFAMQVIGGNSKTARMMGLDVGRYVLLACAAGGAAAGLAGMVEVAAVHGRANASLAVGYGYSGILVSFLARHNPLAIVPVAILLGGIGASGGLLQRRLDLPDAAVVVLQGILFVAMLAGAIRVSTPFIFVSIGECLTERSGRINLGLEGTLMMGAMSAYGVALGTDSPWLGVLVAAAVGLLLGALHAAICQLPRVNDIATGIGLMLFGTGLAFFLGKPFIQPKAPNLGAIELGWWSDIPQVRQALQVNHLFLVGIVLAIVLAWALKNTRWGLIVRLAGESVDAALAIGVPVGRVRLIATSIGGALAGIGGAFLSLYYPGSWNEGLSSGQGLMAVALVIFARWDPVRCLWASLLFGAAGAISPALQSVGVTQGYYLFSAAPYVLTLALMIASCSPERSLRGAPGELGAVQ